MKANPRVDTASMTPCAREIDLLSSDAASAPSMTMRSRWTRCSSRASPHVCAIATNKSGKSATARTRASTKRNRPVISPPGLNGMLTRLLSQVADLIKERIHRIRGGHTIRIGLGGGTSFHDAIKRQTSA